MSVAGTPEICWQCVHLQGGLGMFDNEATGEASVELSYQVRCSLELKPDLEGYCEKWEPNG